MLRLERIVVHAAKTRLGFGPAELAQQVAAAVDHYRQHPACDTLVCFVYDPEGRLAGPRALERDLSGERLGLTVRVLIAPRSA